MRYICSKRVVTKIFDGLVENEDDIVKLLNFVCSKDIICTLKLSTGMKFDKVKILSIQDKIFRWKYMKNHSTLDTTSNIADIDCLEVEADGGLFTGLDPNPSRWTVLDC